MDANLNMHGISYTEYRVLNYLSLAPEMTLSRIELARRVGLTASGITRMLAPMEKIGLVGKEAHPRDARKSLVKLSKAGKQIQEDASVTYDHVASGLFDSLPKAQLDALSRLFSSAE